MAACQLLLIAFLLVDGSLASRQSFLPSTSSPISGAPLSRRHSNNIAYSENGRFNGVAFPSRKRRDTIASCEAIICNGSNISSSNHRDESPTPSQTQINPSEYNSLNPLDSILSIRGGSSSSNNVVQSFLKSFLASPSLPSPIKKLLETICQFIENLTGWKVLPRVETKKSKSKKLKPKEKEGLDVGASTGTKKKRRSKSSEQEAEALVEVKAAVVQKKKRRRSKSAEEPAPSVLKKPKEAVLERQSTAPTQITPLPKTSTPKPKRPDVASQKFLSNKIKSSNPNYRIQRELKEFISSPPPGLSVKISGKNVRLWAVTLTMPENTIYAGDTYKLRVQFPNDYPTSPPSVYFLPPTPRHEHVYTNGDICLSLLGKDWRPIMTAQSIAQAIMSILCGAQRKSLPMDNARHAGNKPGKKQDDWVYHDDNC
eukprot:CAMPEP_0181116362 /NCGR_PEP_ID=MMETSP1071-20121207/21909_1 /TAXON_ID=35127 /ORGANISM="Thalassiosira sp., Strain NH16" /LENGTH=426 /DNA_ID=CAMNT_0023200599 /DNA_START=78 /DNA_END=1358 /DNA_ORIENTATION=+